MEQVEDVKRYRKVIETVRVKVVAVRDADNKVITKASARQSIQDWIDADEIGDELFIKSFDNRYDVDNTTLLGWTAEVVRFEWRTVKSKTSETTAVVREPKARPTVDRKGRPITYTNGNRLVNRRGYNPATVVKKTTTTPLTAEQIEERKARLRGGHFIGATYLGK